MLVPSYPLGVPGEAPVYGGWAYGGTGRDGQHRWWDRNNGGWILGPDPQQGVPTDASSRDQATSRQRQQQSSADAETERRLAAGWKRRADGYWDVSSIPQAPSQEDSRNMDAMQQAAQGNPFFGRSRIDISRVGYNPQAPAGSPNPGMTSAWEQWRNRQGGGQIASAQPVDLQQAPPQRPNNPAPSGGHWGSSTPYSQDRIWILGADSMAPPEWRGRVPALPDVSAADRSRPGYNPPQRPGTQPPQMYQGQAPAQKPAAQQPFQEAQMPVPEMNPYGGWGGLKSSQQPQQAQSPGAWGAGTNLYGNAWGG